MGKSIKGTRTEKNLAISFAGESQARMRYTYFASVAKKEIIKPATIAVMIPFSGLTPEAIPKAMARGKATIPTMIPAIRSVIKSALV